MNVRFRFRSGTAAWLVLMMTIAPTATWSEQDGDSELRKELDAVKKQLRRVEEQMKKQEELIRKLTAERPAAVPTAPPPAIATEEEQRKAEELKRKIEEDIAEKLQPALAAANKTFPSQFNPAIGFIIDTVGSYTRQNQANFEFRSGELGISASVDPFARGYLRSSRPRCPTISRSRERASSPTSAGSRSSMITIYRSSIGRRRSTSTSAGNPRPMASRRAGWFR